MRRIKVVLTYFVVLLCLVSGVLADQDSAGRIDIKLPNGMVVTNASADLTQTELKRNFIAGDLAKAEDFSLAENVVYEVKAPDGKIYEIEGPVGANLEQLVAVINQNAKPNSGQGSSLEKAADFIGDFFSGEDDSIKRDRECRQMAIARYNELLEEAMFDPDEQWALDGFESPRHYARAYSDGTYRLCMD